jgi:hypothetical protein
MVGGNEKIIKALLCRHYRIQGIVDCEAWMSRLKELRMKENYYERTTFPPEQR